MALFRKRKTIRLNPEIPTNLTQKRPEIPENLVERCSKCHKIIFQNQVSVDYCCPNCNYHLQFPAHERIQWLSDEGSFEEWDQSLKTQTNPLNFPGYSEKIRLSEEQTGLNEAIVTGKGSLRGTPFAIGVMDSRFRMASMGTIVGEKIVRLFEEAQRQELPVILYIASGGARMQEGILSLMQMAKISQAISQHSQAGLFYATVLTHPTTGRVTASFAMQGDITLAEPEATIGFAGKRVIEQTIKAKLPAEFQTAETVLKNGFIDQIVNRADQHRVLHLLLKTHQSTKVKNQ